MAAKEASIKMKAKYLDKITKLLERTHPKLADTCRIAFKNCFGAVAGYVNGRIFISCGKFGVALRLPPEALEDVFKEEGVRHLKYFPNGHIKKEYAVLSNEIIENERQFKKLVDSSIMHVLSLP